MSTDPHDGDRVDLPCGCIIETYVLDGVNTFVMSACRPGCEFVRYVAEQAETNARPLTEIGGRIDRLLVTDPSCN